MSLTNISPEAIKLEKGHGRVRSFQEKALTFFFLLPAFLFFFVFLAYPIAQSVYYSMFNWSGLGPATDFVGLDNFARIFGDAVFLKALGNGLIIVVLSLLIQLPFSMGLALIVGRKLPGRAFFRTIFFLPYVLSEVITAIMWMSLYNPEPTRGFLNYIFTLVGLETVAWLGDPNMVLTAIFIVLTWKFFGFHLLLYMAGLQNIPAEIEEAATIDGANKRQMFTSIILPLLHTTIRTSIYLSVLGSVQQFALIWIMTKGGPVNASEVMSTYMYRYGFVRFDLGYGSAVAIVMLLLSLAFSVIYLRLYSQKDYLSGV